jgi:hypothetical protein
MVKKSAAIRRMGAGNPPKGYRTIHRLNRSQKWAKAKSYQDARNKSPSTEPVR